MGISINAPRYVDLIGTTATLVFFDSIHLSSKIKNLSEYLGKRTYSLYAVHAPIVRFHAESFEGLVGNDKYLNNSVVYFASAIIIVAISTELLFRLIEKPSVDYAKKIRYSKRI
jgi:peptidoglycan/LPS O-acetylase OafA/YrhL